MVYYINKGKNFKTKLVDLSNKNKCWFIVVNYLLEYYVILAT